MNFIEYLVSKRNIIIIWFIFHGFALFVNTFGIRGEISDQSSWNYIFTQTDKTLDTNLYPNTEPSDFWPFVKFIEKRVKGYDGADYTYWGTGFNGIFYQYGYSEFLAYSLLIFLYLYFRWNSKYSKSKK